MVPGAATSKLQKMQLRSQDSMHTVIEDKENANLDVCGLSGSMQLRGKMVCPIHGSSLE